MKHGVFQCEADLAAVVVEWLQDQRWEVFQEVAVHSRVADIVARRDGILWAIETKLSFSAAVIEQAWNWEARAHYVSVAVPESYRHSRGSAVLRRCCRADGIGILRVSPLRESRLSSVEEEQAPRLNRRILDHISRRLHEEQKTWAPAGNADGQRYSPFKATCKALSAEVRRNPGLTMRQAVDAITHHYSTSATARSSLLRWIREGAVPGVRLDETTRPITLHPEGA